MSIRSIQPAPTLLLCTLLAVGTVSSAQTGEHDPNKKLATGLLDRAIRGEVLNLIVEYEVEDIDSDLGVQRAQRNLLHDDVRISDSRRSRYSQRKAEIDRILDRKDVELVRDYSHLPMRLQRFRSAAALLAYRADAGIKAIYADRHYHPVLAQSLPLIDQPPVATGGAGANGSTIAIVDTGIDFTLPAFGSCTGVGVPAGCAVKVSMQFGSGSNDTTHGTNVAAVALGVAPDAKIAALDVFSGATAYSSDILDAINWVIANQAVYNIVAINMSLGDNTLYSTPCDGVFNTPVMNARSTGVSVIAASGNNAFTTGITSPACTPGVISVGAVYDADVGTLTWGGGLCTDNATAADQITCFSNSADFLTVLAPGALITAAGFTLGGTSQASPHVAGAVAVLRTLYPAESIDVTTSRMTNQGVSITDVRNGVTTPRLELLAAARPANDAFSNRVVITAANGTESCSNRFATAESGEPSHGAGAGGRSIWWQWTAPAAGQVGLDTHGSAIDTVLAVYTGGAVDTLLQVAQNDDDGGANGASGVLFQAQAGLDYQIAVDDVGGVAGALVLNWSLNTAAQADLGITIDGPTWVNIGADSNYTLTVNNAGPQSATGVLVTYTLPHGATYSSYPPFCSPDGVDIVCNLGTLPANESAMLTIVLRWNSAASDATHSVSVQSDLPDFSSTNNTIMLTTSVSTGGSATVPVLPTWAWFLSLVALACQGARHCCLRSGK